MTAAGADLLLTKQDTDSLERKLTLTQLADFVPESWNLTDGGILLGSGTGALTAMAVLADGAIVVGDGATDPVALAAFTSSTGTLKHEQGGIEADISAVTTGGILRGTGAGAMGILAAFLTSGDLVTHEFGGIEADISAVTTGDLVVGSGAGTMALNTAMTQAQAEAGTDTTVRGTTAQRIKQAIDALGAGVSAATKAEMEAATSTTVYASPGRTQNHPGVAKAWARWDVAGTITESYNVTSVTDTAAGNWTVIWATDFSTSGYSLGLGLLQSVSVLEYIFGLEGSITTAQAVIHTAINDGTLTDPTGTNPRMMIFAFGDQ